MSGGEEASIAAPAAPADSASALFAALGRLVREDKITLRLDFGKLAELDSPVASEADGNMWAYGGVALVLIAWRFAGWQIALGVAITGLALYFTLGRVYIHRRIRHRVETKALPSLETWQELWRFGGISLIPEDGQACAAPRGNWMALVRDLSDRS